jgi:hypothetical protein
MNRDQIPFLDGPAKGDASCRHAIGGATPFPNILAIVYGAKEKKLQHIHMHVYIDVCISIDRSRQLLLKLTQGLESRRS